MNITELDAVIESSYDGIYITDGEANTLKINKAYERITGIKRENMLGKNMKDLVKEKYISESVTLQVIEKREITTIEQQFRTGKKAIVTATPVFDDLGKVVMVVTNVRDVTELHELSELLHKNAELNKKYYSELEEMRMQLLDISNMIAKDENMLNVMNAASRVARVDTTVLILGETGVGKEEVAKFIHNHSLRKDKQFIKINCGAIPSNLIESELFGYEKGAFTGANKEGKIGLFELASGGTIFLDEVGELPLDMQVKLLRVLQEREIERIGGVKPIKINVRVLAATNRNLEEMIKNKTFREDLYYRLNVVPITIPPLRARKGDILPLIKHFLNDLNKKYDFNKSFSKETLNCLYEFSWPGNIRQLKNIIERVVIMSKGDVIIRSDLPKEIVDYINKDNSQVNNIEISLKEAVENLEKRMLSVAFEKYGNVRASAKALGIDAATFVRKRKKYEERYELQ